MRQTSAHTILNFLDFLLFSLIFSGFSGTLQKIFNVYEPVPAVLRHASSPTGGKGGEEGRKTCFNRLFPASRAFAFMTLAALALYERRSNPS
jgi:hypothetical protein